MHCALPGAETGPQQRHRGWCPSWRGGIPYKLRERDAQCTYLHGALQLAEKPAAIAVREGILAAAVNHLLGLDVEIRWQDIAAAEAGIHN